MLLFSLRTLALSRGRWTAPERIQAIQAERLRWLVRLAMERTPYFRSLYRGVDPDHFKLRDLPRTTKADLMADFDRTVTDRRITREGLERFMDDDRNVDRLFLNRYVVCHTSGSQGQPMLIVQNRNLLELAFGLQMTRGNTDKVCLSRALERFRHPARLAVVTLKKGFYPSATQFQHMPRSVRRYMNVLWLSQTDPDVVSKLNEFQPEKLTGYASVLDMLALEAEAGRLRIQAGLQQVVNNSEALTDRARARIEKAFGVPLLDNYATGECPHLSNGCPAGGGSHLNADWAVFEVVDERYRPVPAGTPGSKVLITNLANTIQPIIRYEVGDVVTMAQEPNSCACGNRLPRIDHVAGRAADEFVVGEGARRRRMGSIVFVHAFEYLTNVREWQAEQCDESRVVVRLEPVPGATVDLARARHALGRELAMYDYGDVQVEFEVVRHLAPDPATGKYRRMIPYVRTPHERSAAAVRTERR